MIVRVRAFAQMREVFGGERSMDVPEGAAIGALLQMLGEESETAHRALFDGGGSLKKHVILMLNGKRVNHADVPALTLAGGDEVALFPPVAGG
jgi:molybdopterin synthase sulfur carrier subunit